MKWKTDWNGVLFISESPADDVVLQSLFALLPDRAEDCYDGGSKSIEINKDGRVELWFGE